MNPLHADWDWLDASETVSLTELSRVCGLQADELDELIEYGALQPLAPVRADRQFSAGCIVPLRAAGRLRRDFDLDLFAVAVLLGFLGRIDALEHEVKSLQRHAERDGEVQNGRDFSG
ncbi:MAG: chaperone modulator CbpM [Hydrogenophaga sp.]|nr:chaperone modulator CbpM [Burkholderiaceae bacterium]MDZ4131400.1 chaperone modulator CbpM [Hydrogenophaga sp.]MDZ4357289.1 chaperone modulator CbpM [Variovorax sp.]